MAVYDTLSNGRTKYTKRTLEGLLNSVDWSKHRLIVVDNGSCIDTQDVIRHYCKSINEKHVCASVIHNRENTGTAKAINLGWSKRSPGEHCIKIDNDIVVNQCNDWVEQMEEVVRIDPTIGQVGLKRKDCFETVYNENPFYKSVLYQLPHTAGQRWVVVEKQFHVMGSCVLHSSLLLDKIGGLYQIGVYGFDDSFMSARAIKAGFQPVMLPHIDIDHIDDGGNPYQKQKEKLANDVWVAGLYKSTLMDISNGKIKLLNDELVSI
jgi:GT2 family glycosyltransferase